jgi:hypothetical protein
LEDWAPYCQWKSALSEGAATTKSKLIFKGYFQTNKTISVLGYKNYGEY